MVLQCCCSGAAVWLRGSGAVGFQVTCRVTVVLQWCCRVTVSGFRYDLDGAGMLNTSEELLLLSINLSFRLRLNLSETELEVLAD